MSEDLFYYNEDILRTPPGLQKTLDEMWAKMREDQRRQQKEQLRDILESLDYVYIHGDKYVAIEDVLKLV